MDIASVIYWGLGLLVGGLIVYLVLRRTTPSGQAPQVETVMGGVQEAIDIAMTLVAAAEQLAESGQIQKSDRFDYVFERLHGLFPRLRPDVLEAAIEAAVYSVNALVKRLPNKDKQATAYLEPES